MHKRDVNAEFSETQTPGGKSFKFFEAFGWRRSLPRTAEPDALMLARDVADGVQVALQMVELDNRIAHLFDPIHDRGAA